VGGKGDNQRYLITLDKELTEKALNVGADFCKGVITAGATIGAAGATSLGAATAGSAAAKTAFNGTIGLPLSARIGAAAATGGDVALTIKLRLDIGSALSNKEGILTMEKKFLSF
jgi:hypothetical protein